MNSIVLIYVVLSTLGGADPTTEAAKIESKAFEERSRIKSGIFEVTAEGWNERSGKREDFKSTSRIVLDGENLLNDITRAGEETFRDVRSWGSSSVVFYTDRKDSEGRHIMANMTDTPSARKVEARLLIDPRLLGYYPAEFLNFANLTFSPGLISQHTKRVISVTRAELDGRECHVIARELLLGNVTVDTWLDEKRDWSVVRIEITAPVSGGQKTVYATELDYFPEAKRWFPVRCTLETKRDDGTIIVSDRATIAVRGLNQTVDPKLFEPAGLGIPPGTGVQAMGKLGRSGLSQWDGTNVVPFETKPLPLSAGRKEILIGLAVILGIGGAIFALKSMPGRLRPA